MADDSLSDLGPLEAAVAADIEGLGELDDGYLRSRVQIALNLARKLDKGAGMATAAVANELRSTLADLWEAAGDDDGLAGLDLSTPVQHPT